MDAIKTFLLMYWQVIFAVLSSVLALYVIKRVWEEELRYFWLRVSWGFPFIGKIARAGRQNHKVGEDGWYPVETKLCSAFKPRYTYFNKSPDYYKRCENYLNKANELGRSEKGGLLWLLIVGLILLEAVGFAYVLAPFMARNVSADMQDVLAWSAGLTLSVIAVLLTEKTGTEWHENKLIKKSYGWWSDDTNPNKPHLRPDTNITLDNTYADDNKGKCYQLLNRLDVDHKVTPSYIMTVVTFCAVMLIAAGAYWVRSSAYDAEVSESVNQGIVMDANQGLSDPMAVMEQASNQKQASDKLELPNELAAVNKSADQKANNEAKTDMKVASKVTFGLLSLIYVLIQAIGIYFGFKYSLVGIESKKAYRYTKDFNNAAELNSWLTENKRSVEACADGYLQRLQEKLSRRNFTSTEEHNAVRSGLVKRNFSAYMLNEEIQEVENAEQMARLRVKKAQAEALAQTQGFASAPVQAATQQVNAPQVAPTSVQQVSAPPQPAVAVVQPVIAPAQPAATVEVYAGQVRNVIEAADTAVEQADTANKNSAQLTAQVATQGQQVMPDELAGVDLSKLKDEELNEIASAFDLDIKWLQRQKIAMKFKQKATFEASV